MKTSFRLQLRLELQCLTITKTNGFNRNGRPSDEMLWTTYVPSSEVTTSALLPELIKTRIFAPAFLLVASFTVPWTVYSELAKLHRQRKLKEVQRKFEKLITLPNWNPSLPHIRKDMQLKKRGDEVEKGQLRAAFKVLDENVQTLLMMSGKKGCANHSEGLFHRLSLQPPAMLYCWMESLYHLWRKNYRPPHVQTCWNDQKSQCR